jgi:hypothetical protein
MCFGVNNVKEFQGIPLGKTCWFLLLRMRTFLAQP